MTLRDPHAEATSGGDDVGRGAGKSAHGQHHTADGVGGQAQSSSASDLVLDPQGNAYVACYNGQTVRKVTPGGAVSTFIGVAGVPGSQTTPVAASPAAATFNGCPGVVRDQLGNTFAADTSNHVIRKISAAGTATTFAGAVGVQGSADGDNSVARFNNPYAIAIDSSANLYVADFSDNTIRKITPDGTASTIAGTAGIGGSADGTGAAAQFGTIYGIAAEAGGTLCVADYTYHTLRKIVPSGAVGVVTTLAGTAGVAGEVDGAGGAARFSGPNAICVDGAGNVFVGDYIGKTVRKITPAGVVTTRAGSGAAGNADGMGTASGFNGPAGMTVDAAGDLYLAEFNNNTIRKATRTGAKAHIVSPANGSALPAATTVFSWEPGIGATNYALFIGSTPGGYNLYAGIEGTNLFKAVALPAGITIYVTMYSFIGGAWQGDHYAYDPAPSQKAVLQSPAQGSVLAGGTLSLQWQAGQGCSSYACWLGSTYRSYDLGAGAYSTSTNSASFNVPGDGGPIYLTLWSLINGTWQNSTCFYNAWQSP